MTILQEIPELLEEILEKGSRHLQIAMYLYLEGINTTLALYRSVCLLKQYINNSVDVLLVGLFTATVAVQCKNNIPFAPPVDVDQSGVT